MNLLLDPHDIQQLRSWGCFEHMFLFNLQFIKEAINLSKSISPELMKEINILLLRCRTS